MDTPIEPIENQSEPVIAPDTSAPVPAAVPVGPEIPDSLQPRPRRERMFGGRRQGGGRGNRSQRPMEKPEFDHKPIDIARVTRVTKGGKRFSFRTTVIIGDGKGRVAVGMAKGKDVAQSVQKAITQAKKQILHVVIVNGTIPYQVEAKFSSARVLLKPGKGGVKAGGPVRVVAKLAGIHSLTGKLLGRTNNKINIAMATMVALRKLKAEKTQA